MIASRSISKDPRTDCSASILCGGSRSTPVSIQSLHPGRLVPPGMDTRPQAARPGVPADRVSCLRLGGVCVLAGDHAGFLTGLRDRLVVSLVGDDVALRGFLELATFRLDNDGDGRAEPANEVDLELMLADRAQRLAQLKLAAVDILADLLVELIHDVVAGDRPEEPALLASAS